MNKPQRPQNPAIHRVLRIAIVVLVVIGGISTGVFLKRGPQADKAPYEELENFSKVLQYIEGNYVQDVKTKELIEGAIRGMLMALDPHSAYLSPDAYRDMKVATSGKFGGVGIEVTVRNGNITVVSAIDDTPAYKAGLRTGDVVIKIDGHRTKIMPLQDAVNLMRGKVGSKVSLSVARKGVDKPLDFTLLRENIKLQSVKYTRLNDDIGYFRVSSFMEHTGEDLSNAITKMEAKSGKLKGLVLDLRGNPGGLLDQAVRVVNLFIDEGPVVYTIGRDRTKKSSENAQKGLKVYDAPIVVLVNNSSASASEIVAGALQDYGRAVIAGQQSFGKGSVQTIVPMGDDSGLKLTIANYYTPSGRSIQVKGITPDVILDNFDAKIVEESRKSAQSLREADLPHHFLNDDEDETIAETDDEEDVNLVKKTDPKVVAEKGEKKEEPPLSLEDRLKKDYMVAQASGILKTIRLIQTGVRPPEFKLEDEKKQAKAPVREGGVKVGPKKEK